MTAKRFLLVCHDAGGTVPPVLALAESLLENGHDVSILSQPSVRGRAQELGCAFLAFSRLPKYEQGKPLEEQIELTLPALTGKSVGDDVVAATGDLEADMVVVDANLGGALAAAETLGLPSVVLLHSMYRTFVDTWLGEIWPFLAPDINQTRREFGLDGVQGWPSVFAPHDRLLSVVPSVFEAPVVGLPGSLRHFGFLVPSARRADHVKAFPPGDQPGVLVGLGTTYQHQEGLLRAVVEALGGLEVRALVTTGGQGDADRIRATANVAVTDFVPHHLVLDETDVMVAHGGLGSVSAALAFGVPLVCIPLGRDQPLNTERVIELGAGVALFGDPGPGEIASAVSQVLDEPNYREAGRSIAEASRSEGGPAAAVAELEGLLY